MFEGIILGAAIGVGALSRGYNEVHDRRSRRRAVLLRLERYTSTAYRQTRATAAVRAL